MSKNSQKLNLNTLPWSSSSLLNVYPGLDPFANNTLRSPNCREDSSAKFSLPWPTLVVTVVFSLKRAIHDRDELSLASTRGTASLWRFIRSLAYQALQEWLKPKLDCLLN